MTDGWVILSPLLWGEREAFPAALGRPGAERTLTRFMGQMLILQPFLTGPQEKE